MIPTSPPADIAGLMEARATARAERDDVRADELRAQLEALGVEITDAPDGSSTVRRVDRASAR